VCTQAKLSPTDPIKAEGDAMITMPRVCVPPMCPCAASLMHKPLMGGKELRVACELVALESMALHMTVLRESSRRWSPLHQLGAGSPPPKGRCWWMTLGMPRTITGAGAVDEHGGRPVHGLLPRLLRWLLVFHQ
jgi:hypothetical protein